jgi:hypothetical protein
MNWLPDNYEAPNNNIYFKVKNGDSKIRILGDFRHPHTAIMGYMGWRHYPDGTKSPVCGDMDSREEVKLAIKAEEEKTPKHFWALTIWDYTDQAVKCWRITQSTIQQALTELANNEAWGDPRKYNITITRKGDLFKTTYSLIAEPPLGEPPAEAIEAAKAAKIDLRELFIGESPFGVDKGNDEKPPVFIDQMPAGSEGL